MIILYWVVALIFLVFLPGVSLIMTVLFPLFYFGGKLLKWMMSPASDKPSEMAQTQTPTPGLGSSDVVAPTVTAEKRREIAAQFDDQAQVADIERADDELAAHNQLHAAEQQRDDHELSWQDRLEADARS